MQVIFSRQAKPDEYDIFQLEELSNDPYFIGYLLYGQGEEHYLGHPFEALIICQMPVTSTWAP